MPRTKILELDVQEGIDALCRVLPAFAEVGNRQWRGYVLKIASGLASGEVNQAVMVFQTVADEETVFVSAETQQRRVAILEEYRTRNPPAPCPVLPFPPRP